jgi:hypothetical protein
VLVIEGIVLGQQLFFLQSPARGAVTDATSSPVHKNVTQTWCTVKEGLAAVDLRYANAV